MLGSSPLLASLLLMKATSQAARAGTLPKSALVKACDYTRMLWSRHSRLSNNLAEGAMNIGALTVFDL